MIYIFTAHALQRAAERFPGLTVDELQGAAERSRVAKYKTKASIKKSCPKNAKLYMSKGFMGRYYLYNRHYNIVFVVDNKNEVVTVFNLKRG